MLKQNKNNPAFTIVELLIVIVIIGILAAITIVSYTGITKKANESTIQADLSNAKKQIELYKVIHGQYPTGLDPNNCLTGNIAPSPDTNYCLKKSNSTATYTMSNADGTIYTLKLDNGTLAYKITESTGPTSTTTTPIAESFVKTWGGVNSDVGQSIVQTIDGGYAVAGYTTSFGAGNSDVFLIKYDSSGSLIWNKTWGGVGSDLGQSLVKASDGGYVVAGFTNSYGAGGYDVFLVKFDADGNFNWNKTWGGGSGDYALGMVATSDNGYVITGQTYNTATSSDDVFILKYDVSGNVAWNKTWGGSGADIGNNLTKATDGSFEITGQTNSFGAGSEDMFIIKYDTSGSFVWSKTWGGGGIDVGYNIVNTVDNGYVVTGQTQSYGAGIADVILVKYDVSGNVLWSKTWGGSNYEYGWDLVQTTDGGYAMTGQTASYGVSAGSDTDVFFNKYDSSGNLIWNKTWGGSGADIGHGLLQVNNDYLVVGHTGNYGAGNNDMFLAKYNSSGNITNCTSPMCQTPSATVTAPSATVTSPSATITTPSATVTTPSATITTPTATQTTVVAAP